MVNHSSNPSRQHAFSLVEILAVLGLVTVIVTASAPTVISSIQASRLTHAADIVTGAFSEARTIALTFSTDVELRFYHDYTTEEGTTSLKSDGLQIYYLASPDDVTTSDDAFVASNAFSALPENISFSRSFEFSTLLTPERTNKATKADNRPYGYIRFYPDGSTDLTESNSWHVTLIDHRQRDSQILPENFATIQIDPVTGSTRVYRPN